MTPLPKTKEHRVRDTDNMIIEDKFEAGLVSRRLERSSPIRVERL